MSTEPTVETLVGAALSALSSGERQHALAESRSLLFAAITLCERERAELLGAGIA